MERGSSGRTNYRVFNSKQLTVALMMVLPDWSSGQYLRAANCPGLPGTETFPGKQAFQC